MSLCEDYPCCGHTPQDPCDRQPYDEPGFFDTTRPGNEHALCDHENGECQVYDSGAMDDEEEEDDTFWPEQAGADVGLNPTFGEAALMMTGQEDRL